MTLNAYARQGNSAHDRSPTGVSSPQVLYTYRQAADEPLLEPEAGPDYICNRAAPRTPRY